MQRRIVHKVGGQHQVKALAAVQCQNRPDIGAPFVPEHVKRAAGRLRSRGRGGWGCRRRLTTRQT